MKYLIPIISIVLFGCAHAPQKNGPFGDTTKTFDVLCEDQNSKNKVQFYINTPIEYTRFGNLSVVGKDKENHSVKQSECLLERNEKIDLDFDILAGVRLFETSCKIGSVVFKGRDLQKVEDTKNFSFVRRLDGKVWALPKDKCGIKEQDE